VQVERRGGREKSSPVKLLTNSPFLSMKEEEEGMANIEKGKTEEGKECRSHLGVSRPRAVNNERLFGKP